MIKHEEEILVNVPIIDTRIKEQIDKEALLCLLHSHRVNTETIQNLEISLEEIIPALRKAKVQVPENFFQDLAIKSVLPFLEFSDVRKIYKNEKKSKLITILPYSIVTRYNVIPLEINNSYVELAVDNPMDNRVTATLQNLFVNRKIILHLASSKAIDWAIDNIYREIHKQKAMLDLYNRTPNQSAYKVLFPAQKYFILSLLVSIGICVIVNSVITFAILFTIISVGYFLVNPIKIYISLLGFRGSRAPTRVTEKEMLSIQEKELPIYTILIPVFHEKEVLAQNLKNMYNLNYPKDKLDIKILMEEKDEETINEAKTLGLFGSPQKKVEGIPSSEYSEFLKLFDPIIIPSAEITTKPRACNYGLLRAKGEFCVIYDAEDKPDPEQLRKAVAAFHHSNDNLACLQSKLNFFNANENTLTKWFSIEYASWFEFYLQGLDYFNAPIPLGGTSNHFRKRSLDELGRWDPYNVTEDADIGIRLARRGMKTEMIDSYTYEEAALNVKSWIRQRSRWYKGHLQTYLVHMRYPRKLLKDLGTKQFLKFQLTFGSSIFMPIINPFLWMLMASGFILPLTFFGLLPSYVQWICLFNLIVGNISYLLLYVIACAKLKKYRSVPLAILMPFYWALLSIASWRGLIQLIRKPFYWDKTSHGVSKVKPTS